MAKKKKPKKSKPKKKRKRKRPRNLLKGSPSNINRRRKPPPETRRKVSAKRPLIGPKPFQSSRETIDDLNENDIDSEPSPRIEKASRPVTLPKKCKLNPKQGNRQKARSDLPPSPPKPILAPSVDLHTLPDGRLRCKLCDRPAAVTPGTDKPRYRGLCHQCRKDEHSRVQFMAPGHQGFPVPREEPPEWTQADPGTATKMRVMRDRAAENFLIHHPFDRKWDRAKKIVVEGPEQVEVEDRPTVLEVDRSAVEWMDATKDGGDGGEEMALDEDAAGQALPESPTWHDVHRARVEHAARDGDEGED